MTDEQIAAALQKRCRMCDAPPGKECVSILDGQPLPGRTVHYYRIPEHATTESRPQ